MKLTMFTISTILSACFAWEMDPRCPGYVRRLQGDYDMDWQAKVPTVAPGEIQAVNRTRNLRGIDEHRKLQQSTYFQLKMYWQEGYCWQEEWIERKWCMSCQGSSCESGEPLWVQFCNNGDVAQKFSLIPVSGTGGGQLKTASANLCLERVVGNNTFVLAGCRHQDMDTQIFLGIKTDGTRFELATKGSVGKCLVNQWHHPKGGEVIFADSCSTSQIHHTNEWSTYNGGSESNPFTASESTNVKVRAAKCSSSRPCGICEGDCDGDVQCQDGMKCLQRVGIEKVPGCYGAGLFGSNICYQPLAPVINNSTGTVFLRLHNPECSSSEKCGICEGDCDRDDECAGTLKCFQRNGLEVVPGCSGTGTTGRDYCYKPLLSVNNNSTLSTGNNSVSNNSLKLLNPECSTGNRCGVCQGDCDNDRECMGTLKCFQRNGLEVVPGCSGAGTAGRDYCYQPTSSIKIVNSTTAVVSNARSSIGARLTILGCSKELPCGLCQGDCDSDDECAAGLVCQQRSGPGSVVGCLGYDSTKSDFCVTP